ncbi:hypothetical protein EAI_04895, partial [Harpegnathos saltator]
VKRAEIKLTTFYATHNIAFDIVHDMVLFLKDILPDSQIAKDLKLSRTKCTQIIKNVLEKRETEKTVINLINNKFSILVDASTTIVNDKLLCVLVKYVSLENKKVITELLELICLNAVDCSAGKLYSAFEHCLKSKNIPISNIVRIACDNASIMTGSRDSFISRLKKEVPNLIILKCICHSSALIASKAYAKLPNSCETKRHIENMNNNFFGVESRKILTLSDIRWLILQKYVNRLLNNWEVLKHYFYLETLESKNNSAIIIFNNLNDKIIKAYMLFLKYSLLLFDNFNALFQSRK